MNASDYNKREFEAGRLTQKQIAHLGVFTKTTLGWKDLSLAVADFQKRHVRVDVEGKGKPLDVDGKAGTLTRAAIDAELTTTTKMWPLLGYKGRRPIITSGYGPRSGGFHHGLDLLVPWIDSDPDDKVYGVKYGSGKNKGKRWCWTPPECRMIHAVANGVVKLCGKESNGYRYWIDHREHGLSLCTGYLHLDKDTALVDQGSEIIYGQPLATIWSKIDPPHLHYEELDEIRPYKPRKPDMSKALVVYVENT